MLRRDRVLWALASLLSFLLLIAPAIWNRFPLLQYDTGGYLARWYEGTLVPAVDRVYGLHPRRRRAAGFLAGGASCKPRSRSGCWRSCCARIGFGAAADAARHRRRAVGRHHAAVARRHPAHRHFRRRRGARALSAGPARRCAERWERIALVVLVAVSAATHSATLAVLLALLAAAAIAWRLRPRARAVAGIAPRRRGACCSAR